MGGLEWHRSDETEDPRGRGRAARVGVGNLPFDARRAPTAMRGAPAARRVQFNQKEFGAVAQLWAEGLAAAGPARTRRISCGAMGPDEAEARDG